MKNREFQINDHVQSKSIAISVYEIECLSTLKQHNKPNQFKPSVVMPHILNQYGLVHSMKFQNLKPNAVQMQFCSYVDLNL